jgi:ADP-ribose pyrophosphatase YjhB (NUDIX family)
MKAQFTIGAFGIIFDEQDRILLVHRTDYDLWNLPGGSLESGESPWQGAIREIKEETGFEVEVIKIVAVSSRPEKNDITLTFLCRVISGEATLNREADRIEYFEIDKIPKNTVITQVERIKDFIKNPNEVVLKIRTGKSSIDLAKEGKL